MAHNRQNLIDSVNDKIGLTRVNAELISTLFRSERLANPGMFENELDKLRIYKNTTATVGAFSPEKAFIFGIPLNTVPRRKRAIECRELRDLFKAARMQVSGQATDKEVKRLTEFLAQIKQTANDSLDKMVEDANNPKAVFKPTPKQTANQVEFNRNFVETLTLDELAGILTVVNYTTPKSFNSETIDKMRKGTFANLGSIENLHQYVAEQLVTIPCVDYFGTNKPQLYANIAERCAELIEHGINATMVTMIAHKQNKFSFDYSYR